VGVHAGPAFALDRFGMGRELATGWTVGVSALVSFRNVPLDIVADVGYARNDYADAGPSGSVSTWIGGASAAWRPVPVTSRVQPYVLGGLGVYYVEEPDRNAVTPALVAGAGVRAALGRVQPFAEARYLHVFYTDDDLRLLPVVLGVRYLLTP
jgi:hypothetical protein